MKSTFTPSDRDKVEACLIGCGMGQAAKSGMPDFVASYQCVNTGGTLCYKVLLGCGDAFLLFIGRTRRIVQKCQRMEPGFRRYLTQGIILSARQTVEDVKHAVVACVRSVCAAIQSRTKTYEDVDEAPVRIPMSRRAPEESKPRSLLQHTSELIGTPMGGLISSYRFAA